MIPAIEEVRGGYRVAFRLNAQAERAQCFSPVFPALADLYAAHPELMPAEAEAAPARPRRGRPPRRYEPLEAQDGETPTGPVAQVAEPSAEPASEPVAQAEEVQEV